MKKLSLRSIILGSGIAIFVPLICFLILRSAGHTGHVAMPGYVGIDTVLQKTVDGKTQLDTVYHQVGKTNFMSHLNKPVDLSTSYPRETLVINYFTTGESKASDKLTYHLSHIQKGFKLKKHDTSLQLISIAVDPENDNLEAMRTFANKYTLDHDTWTFIKGTQSEVEQVAKNEFFLPNNEIELLKQNKVPGTIVLIDKYQNIRGHYNGLDSMDVKRCIDDIAFMMVEKNKIHEKSRR